ncbi:tRNA (cmo5U34)-methyltransferase [Gracilibacillus orientalis]|uniref:tRNA (Cmo5U34)-methyltransferase n=1 Tax=Gracilibacillus orientalis TaxID=334253 RepID=A0A1I4JV56_9BACI|nr:class I SAM-dependent methyltransferase [Gracilibacillus orientalis]SFL70113.1 tRNA (cmo5U34)-methyltransferase [Gracilibacillus orientalis]
MTISNLSWHNDTVKGYPSTIDRKVPGYQLLHELTSLLLKEKLSTQNITKVLIVGAGGGKELITLTELLPDNVQLTALDPSTKMLHIAKEVLKAKERKHSISFIEGYLEEQDFNQPFDAIICMLTFQFIQGKESRIRFAQYLTQSLHPGAPCFLSTMVDHDQHQNYFQTWRQQLIKHGGTNTEAVQFQESIGKRIFPIDEKELTNVLHQVSFTHISSYFQSLFFKGFVCFKGGTES